MSYRLPFNEGFINDLKERMGVATCYFYPHSQTWNVSQRQKWIVEGLIHEYFDLPFCEECSSFTEGSCSFWDDLVEEPDRLETLWNRAFKFVPDDPEKVASAQAKHDEWTKARYSTPERDRKKRRESRRYTWTPPKNGERWYDPGGRFRTVGWAMTVLGLISTPTKKELRQQHLKLSWEFHPDRGMEPNHEKMALINAAKDILAKHIGA